MIKISYIKYIPYDFTSEVTDYLLGVKDERVSVEIKFKARWYIAADANRLVDFDSSGFIGITDADYELIPDSWVNAGFRIGDIVTITGSVSNNITTGAIREFDDSGAIAFFDATTFVTESHVATALIEGATPLTGVTFRHNFIENDAAESYLSLVDGNENRHTYAGLSTALTSYTDLIRQGVYKSNEIGTVQIKSTGVLNEFILLHKTNISPFVLASQLIDLQNGISPVYYEDDNCLKYIYKISLHKTLSNPNYIQETGDDIFLLGNTGWFDENFNKGPAEYTLVSTVFKDSLDQVIDTPDYSLVNKVEITINSASGRFSNNNTKFTLTHCYIPTQDSEFINTTTDMETNFMFDQNVNTVGSAVVNGRGYGTGKQVLTGIQATYVNANTIVVKANLDLSSSYKSRMANNERNFYLGVTTQSHLLSTEASDKVNVRAALGTYTIDESNSGVAAFDTFDFLSSFQGSFSDRTFSTPGVFVEDWQIGRGIFYVDTTNSAVLKSVKVRIYATHSTYGTFDLESKTYPTDSAPVVSGVQVVNITGERGYKMAASNIFNIYSILRRSDLDVANKKYYEIKYPFKIRWEDFISLPGASNQFYDPTKLQDGKNNDWSRYAAAAGWSIKYSASLVVTEAGFDNEITEVANLTAETYGAAPDWTYDVKSYDLTTVTEITGNVLVDDKTIIKAFFQKTDGAAPHIVDVEGWIGVAPEDAGGDKTIREIHSKWGSESDSPWVSITSDLKAKKEIVGADYIISAIIDNVKLKSLFPGVSRFAFTPRIDEDVSDYKLFEDDAPFLFEDDVQYLYD